MPHSSSSGWFWFTEGHILSCNNITQYVTLTVEQGGMEIPSTSLWQMKKMTWTSFRTCWLHCKILLRGEMEDQYFATSIPSHVNAAMDSTTIEIWSRNAPLFLVNTVNGWWMAIYVWHPESFHCPEVSGKDTKHTCWWDSHFCCNCKQNTMCVYLSTSSYASHFLHQ